MSDEMIEFKDVLNNFGGDLDLLRDTVALSLRYLPQHLERIHTAIQTKNFKELEVSAHTIKGSLSIYLFKPIVNQAFEIEQCGRTQNIDQAGILLPAFEERLKQFLTELSNFRNFQ